MHRRGILEAIDALNIAVWRTKGIGEKEFTDLFDSMGPLLDYRLRTLAEMVKNGDVEQLPVEAYGKRRKTQSETWYLGGREFKIMAYGQIDGEGHTAIVRWLDGGDLQYGTKREPPLMRMVIPCSYDETI